MTKNFFAYAKMRRVPIISEISFLSEGSPSPGTNGAKVRREAANRSEGRVGSFRLLPYFAFCPPLTIWSQPRLKGSLIYLPLKSSKTPHFTQNQQKIEYIYLYPKYIL